MTLAYPDPLQHQHAQLTSGTQCLQRSSAASRSQLLAQEFENEFGSNSGDSSGKGGSESSVLTRQNSGNERQTQHWPFSCDELWVGKAPLSMPSRVDFVVAHCASSLGDVTKVIATVKALGVTVGKIDVYSKCGRPLDVNPIGASMHTLDNVGRNDHVFAYHMANLSTRKDLAPDDVVVFIKDSVFNLHQELQKQGNVSEAILTAAGPAGFGCFLDPLPGVSAFADSRALGKFELRGDDPTYHGDGKEPFKSAYENLESWLAVALRSKLPAPATPVCFGGSFAVKTGNIIKNAHVWPSLTQSLGRADQLEEGHFAERSWAGLLMDVGNVDLGRVLCAAQKVQDSWAYLGLLQDCNSTRCSGSGD